MGTRTTIRNTVGLLALGASLALASPGVNIVRAESAGAVAQGEQAPGAQCSGSGPAGPVDHEFEAFVDQVRREHARAQADAGRSDGEFVVLNNRGYNYGPPRGPSMDAVQAEAAQR